MVMRHGIDIQIQLTVMHTCKYNTTCKDATKTLPQVTKGETFTKFCKRLHGRYFTKRHRLNVSVKKFNREVLFEACHV